MFSKMDAKVKKSCTNCSQLYTLKPVSSQKKKGRRIPLLLECGHSICEVCITNMIKFTEPIECRVCQREMTLSSSNLMLINTHLYSVFPVNLQLLGELALYSIEDVDSEKNNDNDYFIDIKQVLKSVDDNKRGQCVECKQLTTKMCKQCDTVLCENCFNKTHKFHIFKSHVLKEIELDLEPNFCNSHKEKTLDYYCKDCSKPICMDCMIVGGENSCKNHNVIPAQEVNQGIYEELAEIHPKVDENFRRLTKTAVDIGYLLKDIENSSGNSELYKIEVDVQNHFCKLYATVQKHEQEIKDVIEKLKSTEKHSLVKAKTNISESLKKCVEFVNKFKGIVPDSTFKVNLSALLTDAKELVNTPWYLLKDNAKQDALKVLVNEDICTLVSDYIHLEGNVNSAYKLQASSEIGENVEIPPAPSQPVFPPELLKDVRETFKPEAGNHKENHKTKESFLTQAPKYRSKSGSTSSINSIGSSDSYYRRYGSSCGDSVAIQHVPPFAESNQPKPLCVGSQELIYVSHIINPHNFFVQRACHQNTVKGMLKEFRHAVSLQKPIPNSITEGKIFLAYNKADKEWQRCRVVTVDRKNELPICTVFCIDFGSTEVVSSNNLRVLPPARLHSPLPLAIQCSLANCQPERGAWTTEDSVLMQKIIDNKQAVINIRRVSSTSNYNVALECDVTTFEDGVSLAHAFVFHERAKLINKKLLYPKITGLLDKPKIFFNNNDFKSSVVEKVIITHVVSPDKFFIRKCTLQDAFERMEEELEEEYNINISSGCIYCPEVGMVCVVNMDKYATQVSHPGWHRAVITELPGRQRVSITLPDTGETALVHYTALRKIHTKLTKMKALSTECYLFGITPHNKKWSPTSVVLMEKYKGIILEANVEEVTKGRSVGVTLYNNTDPDNIECLNSQMIRYKFAISIGFGFNKTASIPTQDQVYTNKTPLDKPKIEHKVKKPTVKILQKETKNIVKEEDLEAKDKGPIKLEVKIQSCQSPSLVYVTLIDRQKSLNDLFESIQEHYTKNKTISKLQWQVGDKCCTKCKETKTWRRAVIIDINEQQAKVFYSDFGCVENVPLEDLKELVEEFTQIADGSIKCHLSGIMPANSDEWPSLTKEFLTERIGLYPRIFITRNGIIKNKSLPVELWVYHVTQGGALEPNKAEWRCLNKSIVEQGLAVPDRQAQNDDVNDDPDMISFLNITGSVQEWLRLEPPAPVSPIVEVITHTSENEHSEDEIQVSTYDDAKDVEGSKSMFISDWKPAEPITAKEFTGIPTYIDNDGVIFLHDITQEDTLDLIKKALEAKFDDPDKKRKKYKKWTVGQPCIARFYLDNCFYRGRVLEVNHETSTCLVQYVDYGNEECCKFKDMIVDIVLCLKPIQAHKCVLAHIKPINNKWDRNVLDYIHKSIVEKKCSITVSGESINNITPIEINIDKFNINDVLVELGMALYCDGSVPMMPKYVPKKDDSICIESYSEPDFIVEDDSVDVNNLTTSSVEAQVRIDWNKLIEEEENDANESFFMFDYEDLPDEFMCNVVSINDSHLELNVVHNDEDNVLYTEMFAKIQEMAGTLNPVESIYENKACIALFPEDNQWYRASILEYSEVKGLAKVKYVDFGNSEVIPILDIKDIHEDWVQMAPGSVTAKLYDIEVHPNIEVNLLKCEYEKVFLEQGPLKAVVKAREEFLIYVELKNDDNELAYKSLLDNGVFIKKTQS